MSRRNDQRDLSAAAQEYLLALRVMAGANESGRVTAAQVARHLGVTTQAASEMFRRLVADGLVDHAEGRDLHLTKAGRAAADGIFRRHALLEWLLTSVVGLGWAESDDEPTAHPHEVPTTTGESPPPSRSGTRDRST